MSSEKFVLGDFTLKLLKPSLLEILWFDDNLFFVVNKSLFYFQWS